MTIKTMTDVVCAAHMSSYVVSPFDGLGGIMMVAPPEALKTAILKTLANYPSACLLTDINTQQLTRMRDNIASNVIRTLVMLDLQKIYERDGDTARNVEGNLRAMASEGFESASFQAKEVNRVIARCVVIGALTPMLMEANFPRWQGTGFARRFLFPLFVLEDADLLMDAIIGWKRIDLGRGYIPPPINRTIPFDVTVKERETLRHFCRYQYGRSEPLQMLCKIYNVLKWHYKEEGKIKQAWDVMEDFAPSLLKEGTKLTIDAPKVIKEKR